MTEPDKSEERMALEAQAELSQITVTVHDVMATGHCVRGMHKWFDGHGIDFKAFLREGVSAETLAATEDAMAFRAIRHSLEQK